MRKLLMGFAIFALLAGIWAGWLRVGWHIISWHPSLILVHGPIMISGFLGTLISVERVIALQRRWLLIVPFLCGVGGLLFIIGVSNELAIALTTLGSLGFLGIMLFIFRKHRATYTAVIAFGALFYSIGNFLWLLGEPINQVVYWWAGFLVLTIAGERLELGRVLRLSRFTEKAFLAMAGMLGLSLVLSIFFTAWGARLFGAALIGMAYWLARNDIARRTIRQKALPRYIAICLLTGYFWLGFAGILGVSFGHAIAGPKYDAFLHAIFIGFVISMIFGHAPIIFPAILGIPITYHPAFYIHLGLLHISLVVRIIGDLALVLPLRTWGSLFNGIAILIFLVETLFVISRTWLISKQGKNDLVNVSQSGG